MILYIQKKMNFIFTLLLIITSIILYTDYILITKNTNWGIIGIIISFIIIIFLIHFLLNFIQLHYEKLAIYRMISKKQIALAKIDNPQFYKTYRDYYFQQHHIYQFDIELYTQKYEIIHTHIYEDIQDNHFPTFPIYGYVTYNGHPNKISLIPTFLLFMMPKLKPIVKKYEEKYSPRYIEIIKKNGLSLKPFSNKK